MYDLVETFLHFLDAISAERITCMYALRARWREAMSEYIFSTAPQRVRSLYSLYMLCVPVEVGMCKSKRYLVLGK